MTEPNLRDAAEAAEKALMDARNGLDYGLAGWRKVDNYHDPYDAGTPNCATAAGYLQRARQAHRALKHALQAEPNQQAPASLVEAVERAIEVLGVSPHEANWRARCENAHRSLAAALSASQGETEGDEHELELRLAYAYDVVSGLYAEHQDAGDGDVDEDWLDQFEELASGFLSALDLALTGRRTCLTEEEVSEQREAALRMHRDVLDLGPAPPDQGETERSDRTRVVERVSGRLYEIVDFRKPVGTDDFLDPETANVYGGDVGVRAYRIEVCAICGCQLSTGVAIAGRCENRDHWRAGGVLLDVIPAAFIDKVVEELEKRAETADALSAQKGGDRYAAALGDALTDAARYIRSEAEKADPEESDG